MPELATAEDSTVSSPKGKILVIDDEADIRESLDALLSLEGYEVDLAVNGTDGTKRLESHVYDLVLLDLMMPDRSGMDVLRDVRDRDRETPIFMITAFGSTETAVHALKLGANDYFTKPWENDKLLIEIDRTIAERRLLYENTHLKRALKQRYSFPNIIGKSERMLRVLDLVSQVATSRSTILITGETGTGKELIAKAIHAHSPRAEFMFVPVNSGSLPQDLLESTLFGHVKGAFTSAIQTRKGYFEVANHGTIFFDEIGTIGAETQAKLLRVIQEKEFQPLGSNDTVKVDVRILAATNDDLKQLVEEGKFRQDLYYRLNVARFQLPPLRERREDIPHLITYFLEKYSRKMGVKPKIQDNITEALAHHDCPGNIRELEHMIEQAVALVQNGVITADDLLPAPPSSPYAPANHGGRALADVVDAAERTAIEGALRESDGSRERAAEVLNISQTTLWRKMTRLGITFEGRG